MGALLESGLVGNIGLKHLKVIKEDTINKWDKLGFLDGLKGHIKENMAQLYENQASHLINEASASDNSGSFETVVFPIVRRVFSKLLANDLVSVQAMNLPIGKLFYFVPKIQGYQAAANNQVQHYPPVGSPTALVGDATKTQGQGYGAVLLMVTLTCMIYSMKVTNLHWIQQVYLITLKVLIPLSQQVQLVL